MIIDNAKILSLLNKSDMIKFYNLCVDLSHAGKDYKVNEIVCFSKDDTDPLDEYIHIKKYDDHSLLIFIQTENESLLNECFDYIDTIRSEFNEIEIRTPFESIYEMDRICKYFSFSPPEYPASPVYYIQSEHELLPICHNDLVSVSLFRETDKAEIARAVSEGRIDAESMNPDMFVPCTIFSDVKWYILRVGGEIAGYLRSECGYANIYDIGWLYVEPRFRGHGYATELVKAFSYDMFAKDMIPHYGFAVSKASARVAEKCGYVYDDTKLICRSLKQKQE